ncbi:MAG: biopolymer transporter ExbD [Alphaproteobacteria bacterium]|nr:biopolymer transporter ExbD [Alphaproteobacteria bacterium]
MSLLQNYSHIRRQSRRRADVNITNLMDVMMVLLVVFMVAAPLMTSGIPLNLPKVGGKALNGEGTSVNISVDKEGAYYIGQSIIPDDEVLPKLEAIKGQNSELSVTISGDTTAAYGRVIGLMAMLKEAGYDKVGLKTEAKTPAARRAEENREKK